MSGDKKMTIAIKSLSTDPSNLTQLVCSKPTISTVLFDLIWIIPANSAELKADKQYDIRFFRL